MFTAEEDTFRRDVREKIQEILPDYLAEKTRNSIHLCREDMACWNKILHENDWSVHHWPEAYGGPGWSPIQRYIFESEIANADAPPTSVFGVYLVGPTIFTFGSDAQKDRYLPGIRSGKTFWCQGYSEPNAGSDLASVRTKAERSDDGWIIQGEKAWTTEGQFADFMICLARTDPDTKPQRGLSAFIIPMDTPGVELRPVITMDGAHSVNSVFLDNVRVPEDALIGEENLGWTYTKFLLNHERTNNAQVHRSRREFERLKELFVDPELRHTRSKQEELVIQHRISCVEVELRALEGTVLRVLADETDGRDPGAKSSILKVMGSTLQQTITELAMDILGESAVFDAGPATNNVTNAQSWVEKHLFRRVVTIYAGTNEIQKTIIARTIFGN